jgi:hypothetical protein
LDQKRYVLTTEYAVLYKTANLHANTDNRAAMLRPVALIAALALCAFGAEVRAQTPEACGSPLIVECNAGAKAKAAHCEAQKPRNQDKPASAGNSRSRSYHPLPGVYVIPEDYFNGCDMLYDFLMCLDTHMESGALPRTSEATYISCYDEGVT